MKIAAIYSLFLLCVLTLTNEYVHTQNRSGEYHRKDRGE
jgi:hypothetical protein